MPLLLILVLFLVALLVAASSHGDAAAYDASKCLLQSYTCGGVSISYPFYYADKTGVVNGSSDSYCGYPGMAIKCDDDKAPVVELNGEKYRVTAINYSNLTVSLADPDALKPAICPRVDHNVTVPLSPVSWSWLHLPASNVIDYLVLLLDCSFTTALGALQLPTGYRITCQGFGPAGLSSFVLPKDQVPQGNWSHWCPKIVEVPVLKHGLYGSFNSNEPGWGSDGYAGFLRQGFQLVWQSTPDQCSRCERSSGGRCAYNGAGGFVACLCPDGRVNKTVCSAIATSRNSHFTKRTKLYIIVSTSSVLLLCLLFFAVFLAHKKYRFKMTSNKTPRIESFLHKNASLHPKRYTYAQVKKMTKSFAEKLGHGGFGAVYRGDLSDGRQIAVKKLKDSNSDGEEFINEVASISKTSHVNVVTLLGFCLEGSKRALIYDYMPNGSLERYAFRDNSQSENTLGWEKLFDIAVGIARGLEYLHRGCNTRVVHFDIKPHNILLDQDFCPKISDFGLAKLCLNKESAISIDGARGTIGYIAPEVYSRQFGAVSSKSDVYSYGMMILEMVGARDKNFNANSDSSSQYFPQWVYEHLDEYCISASEINGETTEIVRKMIVVGLWCIQLSPPNRPTMTRVVEMLEGSTSGLELPPKVLLS